jgi:hypothetical protein
MTQIANFLNGFGIRFGVAGSASVTLSKTNSECRRIHPSLIGYKPFKSESKKKGSGQRHGLLGPLCAQRAHQPRFVLLADHIYGSILRASAHIRQSLTLRQTYE